MANRDTFDLHGIEDLKGIVSMKLIRAVVARNFPGRAIIAALLLLLAVVWWEFSSSREKSQRSTGHAIDRPQFQQPVGWAFGRMIGAPQPSYISPHVPASLDASIRHAGSK